MNKLLLKKTAIQSVALMIAVITLSYAIRQQNGVKILADDIQETEAISVTDIENISPISNTQEVIAPTKEQYSEETEIKEDSRLPEALHGADLKIAQLMGERLLILKKPSGDNVTMTLEDLYMTKSIRITLKNTQENQFESKYLGRILEEEIFIGEPKYIEVEVPVTNTEDETVEIEVIRDYGKDPVHGITVTSKENEGAYSIELLLEMDQVYAHIILEDEAYYYIGLKRPSEVYDRIVVLDAGHGGKDSGALSKDESIYEKNINLKILLELKELLDKEDIKVYYTRLGDDKVFLRPRVELANAVDSDYFISIHCNANGSAKPNGTEIYYVDTVFKQVPTEALARIFSEEISKTSSLKKGGIIRQKKDDVFILQHSIVPAILIETGYMTNSKDLNYLIREENQEAIALGLFQGIMRAYSELTPVK